MESEHRCSSVVARCASWLTLWVASIVTDEATWSAGEYG